MTEKLDISTASVCGVIVTLKAEGMHHCARVVDALLTQRNELFGKLAEKADRPCDCADAWEEGYAAASRDARGGA